MRTWIAWAELIQYTDRDTALEDTAIIQSDVAAKENHKAFCQQSLCLSGPWLRFSHVSLIVDDWALRGKRFSILAQMDRNFSWFQLNV